MPEERYAAADTGTALRTRDRAEAPATRSRLSGAAVLGRAARPLRPLQPEVCPAWGRRQPYGWCCGVAEGVGHEPAPRTADDPGTRSDTSASTMSMSLGTACSRPDSRTPRRPSRMSSATGVGTVADEVCTGTRPSAVIRSAVSGRSPPSARCSNRLPVNGHPARRHAYAEVTPQVSDGTPRTQQHAQPLPQRRRRCPSGRDHTNPSFMRRAVPRIPHRPSPAGGAWKLHT